MNNNIQKIIKCIKKVPNFPKKGINFKDITPIFANPNILSITILEVVKYIKKLKIKFDYIAGLESRGFLIGVPIAQKLNLPFIPIRKKGKLPRKTVSASYALEYGTASIEIHKDDIKQNSNVLLIDDIVATGGTLIASKDLMNKVHAKCNHAFILGWLANEFPKSLELLSKKGINLHYLFKL